MLQGAFMDVLQARTPEGLLSELVHFAQRLEFETVSATVIVDHLSDDSEFMVLHNAPAAYVATFSDREKGRRDPVSQYCKQNNLPLIWDQSTYTAVSMGDQWEEQAEHGYAHGIAMAMHLPGSRHFFFGAERDQRLPDDPDELVRMVADFRLLTTYAQEAAFRIFLPEGSETELPSLTPRELDALRWTMEGKTAWEVGEVLGIGERNAVMHLHQAMRKLGCTSKHQAVLKALRMGMFR